MEFSFLHTPNPEQVQQIFTLYRDAGWWTEKASNPDLIRRIVSGSHCFAAAFHQGRIVGMGRAVSDRASDAYIQDVTVDAEYRRRGIGRQLVKMLIERLHRDGLTWIGLIAERNTHEFYRPLGFQEMPDAAALRLQDHEAGADHF